MIRSRWKQALPAALLVHGCKTLCAVFVALPLATSVAAPPASETLAVRTLIVGFCLFGRISETPARYAALPLGITLLTAPFWLVLWLRANVLPDRLERHAQLALARYPPALAVALVCLVYAALLLLMAAGAAFGAHLFLAPTHDARFQTGAGLLAAAPFVAALLHAATWFDLGQAELAQGTATPREALRAALSHATLRLVALRAVFGFAGIVLTAIGLYAPRAVFGLSARGTLATLASMQLLALAVCLLRGAWLALLVERMQRSTRSALNRLESESPALRAAGNTAPKR
jgi:hypothetical protein